MNKKETIRNGFDEFVCLRSNLSNEKHNFCLKARSENEYGFQRSGLKTGTEIKCLV